MGEVVLGAYAASCGLTERERQILEAIVDGRSNKEIAAELFLALSTVKNHVSNIFRKAGVNSRYELMAAVHSSANPAPSTKQDPTAGI